MRKTSLCAPYLGILAVFLVVLALPALAGAQPACPPGSHFVPGRGCVPNAVPPPPGPPGRPPVWAPPAHVPPEGAPAVIVGGASKLRDCPAPGCRTLLTLPPGERVLYLRHERGFGQVIAPRFGVTGWVRLNHLANSH